jgi:hypothetical protein
MRRRGRMIDDPLRQFGINTSASNPAVLISTNGPVCNFYGDPSESGLNLDGDLITKFGELDHARVKGRSTALAKCGVSWPISDPLPSNHNERNRYYCQYDLRIKVQHDFPPS